LSSHEHLGHFLFQQAPWKEILSESKCLAHKVHISKVQPLLRFLNRHWITSSRLIDVVLSVDQNSSLGKMADLTSTLVGNIKHCGFLVLWLVCTTIKTDNHHLIPRKVIFDSFDRLFASAGKARSTPWSVDHKWVVTAGVKKPGFAGPNTSLGVVAALARYTVSRFAPRLAQ